MSSEELYKLVEGDDDARSLVASRASKRSSCTKTINSINYDNIAEDGRDFLVNKLSVLRKDLLALDDKIHGYLLTNDICNYDQYMERCTDAEAYTDKIDLTLIRLGNLMFNPIQNNNHDQNFVPRSVTKLSLPHVELPAFDGKPESYHKFITCFEKLISKYDLSSFEKYSYLIKQLSGPAKSLVESVSLSDLSYESAIKILNEAYSDKLEQQYSIIERLVNLKLDGDCSNAYEWISESRVLLEQINCLKISTDIMCQFFLWRGLSTEFKSVVTSITGKSKPALKEIIDSSFEANNRFIESQKVRSSCKSLSLATVIESEPQSVGRVKDSFRGCSLCVFDKLPNTNHKLSQCDIYKDGTSRVSKLNEIGGCIKCGKTNHSVKYCRYRLSRPCTNCKDWHMVFLCNGRTDEPDKVVNKKPQSKRTSNSAATFMESDRYNDVVLPTASVSINTKKGNQQVRIFKDLGSQSTFVTESLCKLVRAEVVKETEIKISGINSEKLYKSRVVKFPINVKGQGKQTITAVCLDKVFTDFEAPGLCEVAKSLKHKGYELADHFTSNKIGNISILLGSDHSHILPLTQLNFASDSAGMTSAIYQTPAGVMLSGSLANYKLNISALPENVKVKSSK